MYFHIKLWLEFLLQLTIENYPFLMFICFLCRLLAPVGEDEYGWTNKEAAFNVNLISSVNFIVAIVAFVVTRVILKW